MMGWSADDEDDEAEDESDEDHHEDDDDVPSLSLSPSSASYF